MAKTAARANTKQTKGSTQPRKRAVSPAEKRGLKAADPQPEIEREPLLGDGEHRRLAGIACIVIAAILLVIISLPNDAVVAAALSTALKRLLGIGSVMLPIALVVVGITYLVREKTGRIHARIAIGLAVICVAILGISGLLTPVEVNGATDLNRLFEPANLETHGGYIGAGIAFAGLATFGFVPSMIVLVGCIVAGIVILGITVGGVKAAVVRERERILRRSDSFRDEPIDAPRVRLQGERRVDPAMEALSNARTQAIGAPAGRGAAQAERSARGNRGAQGAVASQAMTRRLGRRDDEPAAAKNPDANSAKSSAKTVKIEAAAADGQDPSFALPPTSLLKESRARKQTRAMENELVETAQRLQKTMEDFGVMATVVDWVAGPTVTLFEVDLPPGVRVSKLVNLNDDIALALAAQGVRIFAPIPGTHYVGIEVPNKTRENVLLGDVIKDVVGGPLDMAIGKDVEGNTIVGDLAKMPHLLIGGTTGSGKSVCINGMIVSMLMRNTPEQVRFIMIDPKRVEFSCYDGIPHLYVPVVTEPKEAASALSWGVAEMERRLKVFSKAGVRNISSYNEMVEAGATEDEDATKLPYIVIVIDELADLMMNVGKEVEFSISRIAQLARAAGIHLIVATQRPSANVVTGLIKANITTRIGLMVASGLDSRVILDTTGAEDLVGNGDLLLSKPEYPKPLRVQGCYTSDAEINAVVEFVKSQGEPDYHQEILSTNIITMGASQPDGSGGAGEADDPLLWEAADIVVASGLGSTSNIQRKLKVGYSRAGRIIDMLEEKGVVGPPNGSKPRDVLVDAMELEALKAFEANDVKQS